jgi:hypothetical protein
MKLALGEVVDPAIYLDVDAHMRTMCNVEGSGFCFAHADLGQARRRIGTGIARGEQGSHQ